MIYNTGVKFGKSIFPPTQEEIYRMPEYFALSREEILAHHTCPEFLKRIIGEFPWDGRKTVLQVRPQDFRKGKPELLGDHWHVDVMVRLRDGTMRNAKNLDEFHLMVCSWGNVVETEFIGTPLDLPDLGAPHANHGEFFAQVNRMNFEVVAPKPTQLVEYTSRDIHRMGRNVRYGAMRLMIVAFDTDGVDGGGMVLPSIHNKELGLSSPKFKDYVV